MEATTKALIDLGAVGILAAVLLMALAGLAVYTRSILKEFSEYRNKREDMSHAMLKDQLETNNSVSDALASVSGATCSAVSELARETRTSIADAKASITNLERSVLDALARMPK